ARPMNAVKSAVDAIQAAEARLRELMQEAISTAGYRDLPLLARAAEQLNETAAKLEQPPQGAGASPAQAGAIKSAARRVTPAAPSRRRLPKKAYPKFRRESDKLVKIGWSKSERSEYRHRVPKQIVHTVLTSICKIAPGETNVFSV